MEKTKKATSVVAEKKAPDIATNQINISFSPSGQIETEEVKVEPTKEEKSEPELISYEIGMVIPTVAYGNVQPKIVVKANSLEEAHDFIVPHLNKLWKEYYLVERLGSVGAKKAPAKPVKPEPVKTTPVEPEPAKAEPVKAEPVKAEPVKAEPVKVTPVAPEPVKPISFTDVEPEPTSANKASLIKATQAINSCFSLEALARVINQVNISTNLTDEDRETLKPKLEDKEKELNGK